MNFPNSCFTHAEKPEKVYCMILTIFPNDLLWDLGMLSFKSNTSKGAYACQLSHVSGGPVSWQRLAATDQLKKPVEISLKMKGSANKKTKNTLDPKINS